VAAAGSQVQGRVRAVVDLVEAHSRLEVLEEVLDYVVVAVDAGDVEASLAVDVLAEQEGL